MAHTEADIADAVKTTWQACFPFVAFEPDRTWIDAGLDSLKAMELVLRLERALGMPIPFDTLTPDHTARDLVRSLLRTSRAGTASGDERERVFLMPGILGDNVALAKLRQALSHHVDFRTLRAPDLEAPASVLGDLGKTADLLTDELIQLQPTGDFKLVGYSFGALLGQEVAWRLEAKGRRLSCLVALDGLLKPARTPTVRKNVLRLFRLTRVQKRPAPQADHPEPLARVAPDNAVFYGLVALRAYEAARRLILRAGPRHDQAWTDRRRRELLGVLRHRAIMRWTRKTCSAPTLLIVSEDFERQSSLAAWQAMCPTLRVVSVPSGHFQMFDPPSLAIVVAAFLAFTAERTAA